MSSTPKSRLEEEITSLSDRTFKLSKFLSSPAVSVVSETQHALMLRQLALHEQLLAVLRERLSLM